MTTDLVDRFGRLALAAMFINAVPGKLTDFGGTVSRIAAKGIPLQWRVPCWQRRSCS